MSAPMTDAPAAPSSAPEKKPRARRKRWGTSLLAYGEPSVWLTGGALAVAIAMIVGLLALIFYQGAATFWPKDLVQIRTVDGKVFLGEITREETYKPEPAAFDSLPPATKEKAIQDVTNAGGMVRRRLLRTGNFESTGTHHHWISDFQIAEETHPEWGLVIERTGWGNFYGSPKAFNVNGEKTGSDAASSWTEFNAHTREVIERLEKRIHLERHAIGAISRQQDDARLAVKQAEISYGKASPQHEAALKDFDETIQRCTLEDKQIKNEIASLNSKNDAFKMTIETADGKEKVLPLTTIVRAYPANQLGFWDKVGIYFSRWGEFLVDRPRESNTEGGVLPAIWGTVALTLLLSLAVVPFGVLAALYLREYAKSGVIISAVRIAINNLAGVPSIVFGVFGMGFFCYLLGKFVDKGPRGLQIEAMPSGAWWVCVAVTVVLGVAAFLVGVSGPTKTNTSPLRKYAGSCSMCLWIVSLALLVYLIVKSPFFSGFYEANEGPVFGTGGIFWASLTLALLTVPVVIVATEEALAAVPNSMREGSYACGASKWQTIYRIVLPRAMPGIMTGMILAMARGAGEVAPIMLVGAVKLAPHLAVDGVFPYLHPSRSFMHLGFHIYDVGFQSPNSEAARPMVYTTTLLLIAIVALLNLTAVWLRSRLRRRFKTSQF